MRATLALYAFRFGGWLLAHAAGAPVLLTVEIHGSDDVTTLRRAYPDDDAYVASIVTGAIRS